MWKQVTVVLAVVLTGLVAGIMIGTGLSLYAAKALAGDCWTLSFQQNDIVFGEVMRPLFLASLVALFGAAGGARFRARSWFIVASIAFVCAVGVTLAGNVPINLQVRSWNPALLPGGWQVLRDKWLWLHLLRSAAAVGSFIAALLGFGAAKENAAKFANSRVS